MSHKKSKYVQLSKREDSPSKNLKKQREDTNNSSPYDRQLPNNTFSKLFSPEVRTDPTGSHAQEGTEEEYREAFKKFNQSKTSGLSGVPIY
jgi:hypothetical protein